MDGMTRMMLSGSLPRAAADMTATNTPSWGTKGNYIHTYMGHRVYLPNPTADSIDLIDIAHALSIAPRFAGHLDEFLSVAEHSVNVCDIVRDLGGSLDEQRQALLHDATEAYLCDIPTPFKSLLGGYKELEEALWNVIADKFKVERAMYPIVKRADAIALMSERDAYKTVVEHWGDDLESLPRHKLRRVPLTQGQAYGTFSNRYADLFI